MIDDHIWLLDMGKIFKGKKHIILMTPDASVSQDTEDLGAEISAATTTLSKKNDRTLEMLTKRLEILEKNNRALQKQGLAKTMSLKMEFLETQKDVKLIIQKLQTAEEKKEEAERGETE
jgi:hypothetical protein